MKPHQTEEGLKELRDKYVHTVLMGNDKVEDQKAWQDIGRDETLYCYTEKGFLEALRDEKAKSFREGWDVCEKLKGKPNL